MSSDEPLVSPRLQLGEVAFLVVTDVNRFGAFVDWGLPKELLVPFAEQTRDLAPGDVEPIGLMQDDQQRPFGTMRVAELLRGRAPFRQGEWIEGEAWRKDPDIGLFVILERRYVGLLPADEPHDLQRGEAASFRVSQVLPDGKLELSLRGLALDEIENDAQHILAQLAVPNAPPIHDRADPDQIRARFGISKKAFKRAVGRLLKQGDITLDRDGKLTRR